MTKAEWRNLRHSAGFVSDEALRRRLHISRLWEKGGVRKWIVEYVQLCRACQLPANAARYPTHEVADPVGALRGIGWQVKEVACFLGVGRSCLDKWRAGNAPVPQWACVVCSLVLQVHALQQYIEHKKKPRKP